MSASFAADSMPQYAQHHRRSSRRLSIVDPETLAPAVDPESAAPQPASRAETPEQAAARMKAAAAAAVAERIRNFSSAGSRSSSVASGAGSGAAAPQLRVDAAPFMLPLEPAPPSAEQAAPQLQRNAASETTASDQGTAAGAVELTPPVPQDAAASSAAATDCAEAAAVCEQAAQGSDPAAHNNLPQQQLQMAATVRGTHSTAAAAAAALQMALLAGAQDSSMAAADTAAPGEPVAASAAELDGAAGSQHHMSRGAAPAADSVWPDNTGEDAAHQAATAQAAAGTKLPPALPPTGQQQPADADGSVTASNAASTLSTEAPAVPHSSADQAEAKETADSGPSPVPGGLVRSGSSSSNGSGSSSAGSFEAQLGWLLAPHPQDDSSQAPEAEPEAPQQQNAPQAGAGSLVIMQPAAPEVADQAAEQQPAEGDPTGGATAAQPAAPGAASTAAQQPLPWLFEQGAVSPPAEAAAAAAGTAAEQEMPWLVSPEAASSAATASGTQAEGAAPAPPPDVLLPEPAAEPTSLPAKQHAARGMQAAAGPPLSAPPAGCDATLPAALLDPLPGEPEFSEETAAPQPQATVRLPPPRGLKSTPADFTAEPQLPAETAAPQPQAAVRLPPPKTPAGTSTALTAAVHAPLPDEKDANWELQAPLQAATAEPPPAAATDSKPVLEPVTGAQPDADPEATLLTTPSEAGSGAARPSGAALAAAQQAPPAGAAAVPAAAFNAALLALLPDGADELHTQSSAAGPPAAAYPVQLRLAVAEPAVTPLTAMASAAAAPHAPGGATQPAVHLQLSITAISAAPAVKVQLLVTEPEAAPASPPSLVTRLSLATLQLLTGSCIEDAAAVGEAAAGPAVRLVLAITEPALQPVVRVSLLVTEPVSEMPAPEGMAKPTGQSVALQQLRQPGTEQTPAAVADVAAKLVEPATLAPSSVGQDARRRFVSVQEDMLRVLVELQAQGGITGGAVTAALTRDHADLLAAQQFHTPPGAPLELLTSLRRQSMRESHVEEAMPILRPQLQRSPQQPPLPAPAPLRSPKSGAVSDRSSSLQPSPASAAPQRSNGCRETAADTWRSAANAAGQPPRSATLQSDSWHSEKSQRSEARRWRPPLPPAAGDVDGSEESETPWPHAVRADSSGSRSAAGAWPWRSSSEPVADAVTAAAARAASAAAAQQRRQPPPGFEDIGSSRGRAATSPTPAAAASAGLATPFAGDLAAATYAAAVGPSAAMPAPGNGLPWQQHLPPPAATPHSST